MKNYNTIGFTVILLITSLNRQAFGYGISPMSLTVEPVGKGATGTFLLENKTDDIVPIESTIVKRSLDIDGKETTSPLSGGEKFIIYPPMLTLKPHEKRTVKVVYNGPPAVINEKAYRFFVSQLPLSNYEKDKNKNALNILMRYGASLYVAPASSSPDVSISEAKAVLVNNEKKLMLIFENKGSAHQNMMNYKIKLLSGTANYTIEWDSIQTLIGPLNVFSRQKRRVVIPWNKKFPSGQLKGEILNLD